MLEVKNLTKKFGEKIAVNDISFTVEEGKIFGLLGRNGAGKTTIFRMILNILDKDSGVIEYNKKKINNKIKDKIGYLPEEGSLIENYTVIEQFIYYGVLKSMPEEKIRQVAIKWLKEFNILEYLNMKIKNLSKGNRQKIQFIISILNDPELIILDEPFSGLDPVSVEEFKKVILKLKDEGKVIIFSSHRMDHVEMLCEDILILDKGNVVISGNLSKIKNEYSSKNLYVTGDIGNYTLDLIKNTEGVTNVSITEDKEIVIGVLSDEVTRKIFNILKPFNITNFHTTSVSLNDIFIDKVGKKYEDE